MTNGNALVPVSDIQKMAEAVAKSNLFGIKTPEQAMSLMLIAQAEGMHPAIAARDYHIIEGKPSLKADAMLARFQAAGGSVKWLTYTDTEVKATFTHPQGGSVEIAWTVDMGKRAGLVRTNRDGTPGMWMKYPRQMLRSRVISEGVRTVCPGVAAGLYTPEEIQDTPIVERDMGNADVVESQQPQFITDEQAFELRGMLDTAGLSAQDFCIAGQCESLPELLADNYESAKKWIMKRAQKKETAPA